MSQSLVDLQVTPLQFKRVRSKSTIQGFLYRAPDKQSKTVDFMLSKRRDETGATTFFEIAIGSKVLPEKVVMDKSGTNRGELTNINFICSSQATGGRSSTSFRLNTSTLSLSRTIGSASG
ncbi:DDE-type integrase/transposase/recombinase [Pseudovibrio sp. Tun.PSC04-5.I4]|uniref:DDE-type integrase/transposase/recombinase n=1 Tax=Pseudovibrio sp. Tun.PSC04-5.I4 TaxID=1798213 RepID=UPI00117A68F3|nr:DDE-type integrase/transposase/recombinase [Pseudovibrio sp. Tun.PSC04-5.I4]